MATVLHSAPRFASNEGVKDRLAAALGDMLLASKEEQGEIVLGVERERIEDALRLLRDEHEYQQLVEMAGVDYPTRGERFEVVSRDACRLGDRVARDGDGDLADLILVPDISCTKHCPVAFGEIGALFKSGKMRAHRSIVPVRRILRWSCRIP